MSWIRVALAFIFFLVVLFTNYQFDDTSETAMGFLKEEVVAFTIKKPGGESLEIKRSENGWNLISPVFDKADSKAIDVIISTAVALSIEKDLGIVTPQELIHFGLDDPIIVVFRLNNDLEKAIRIGNANPAGTERFIQTDQSFPNILLIKKGEADKLVKNFFQLRNKKLLDNINQHTIKKLAISSGELNVVLEKSITDDWRLTAPINATADNEVINRIARQLGEVEIAGFIDDGEYDPTKYGLENPSATIKFTTIGDQAFTVLVGSKTESGAWYVAIEGKPMVVRIAGMLDMLPKSLDGFRNLRFVDFEPDEVDKIAIEFAGTSLVIESENIKMFLKNIKRAKGKRYLDEGKIDYAKIHREGEILKITVTTGKVEQIIEIVNIDEKYYTLAQDAVSVMEVDEKTAKSLYKKLADFEDRRLFPVMSDGVGAILVERNEQVFEVRVVENGYRMFQPENRHVSPAMYSSFVWTIILLKYTDKASEKDISEMGFGNPTLTVAVYNRRDELINKVVFGKKIEGKNRFYAKSEKDKKYYEIDAMFVEEKVVSILKNSLDLQ